MDSKTKHLLRFQHKRGPERSKGKQVQDTNDHLISAVTSLPLALYLIFKPQYHISNSLVLRC